MMSGLFYFYGEKLLVTYRYEELFVTAYCYFSC
jgi:hypothetical protein